MNNTIIINFIKIVLYTTIKHTNHLLNMKKSLLGFLMMVFILSLKSQTIEKTTYFSDAFLQNVVPKEQAKYLQKVSLTDSVTTFVVQNLISQRIISKVSVKHDKPTGFWEVVNAAGETIEYDFDKLVYADEDELHKSYSMLVDQRPVYKDTLSLMSYVSRNLNFPFDDSDAGKTGKINARFKIKTDGAVEFMYILEGVHPFLDYEVYRLIEKMDKWETVASLNGEAIEYYVTLPIIYKVY